MDFSILKITNYLKFIKFQKKLNNKDHFKCINKY